MAKTINVLSVSGGKDSTAMWLYAREQGVEVLPVFADTGHEHEKTYEYLDYLENKLGPIKRVRVDFTERIARKRITVVTKWRDEGISEEIIQQVLKTLNPTGIPFLDLCLWKGRFLSTKARFCTQFLKIEPIEQQVYLPILAEGNDICSWQGVRAQESPERAKLSERESTSEGFEVYRPLLHWTVEDVFSIHKKHNIDPNPLYKLGMSRVGCMPCINCNKGELFEIARRFPKEIARVAEWERIVAKASKHGISTFFSTANGNGNNIDEVIEWSKTAYGGKQYDLIKAIEFDNVPDCSSAYGLCE
ncbi:phosphoadenosine phosphosulfate reductase family protein [Brevibacillus halotolerans]|uniref:phosphoadenosine phosphosulfate reductase family protein n=1 Tax=Brevibacillus TaxID=55080 RepID=UPI00215D3D25|nr:MULTISPECIES: phosphoadenosine phosphosulfate reductase family protein [Brevibacillus]MCR8961638.1 phosphoadenosine phosphosulfate reductase family protein [Brevibacillus laterosporus]MCZ0833793.1 phosphoadenosine phosphosulfate reductase family protein [Brevibacillus halotolerans]